MQYDKQAIPVAGVGVGVGVGSGVTVGSGVGLGVEVGAGVGVGAGVEVGVGVGVGVTDPTKSPVSNQELESIFVITTIPNCGTISNESYLL